MTFTDLRRLHVPVRLLHTNNVAHPLPCHSATAEGWAVSAHAERRNNNSVKLSQGDLMLCPSFDAYTAFRQLLIILHLPRKTPRQNMVQLPRPQIGPRPTAGNDTAGNQNDKVPVKNLRRHQSVLRSTIFFVFWWTQWYPSSFIQSIKSTICDFSWCQDTVSQSNSTASSKWQRAQHPTVL